MTMNRLLLIAGALLVLTVTVLLLVEKNAVPESRIEIVVPSESSTTSTDPRQVTYRIAGEEVVIGSSVPAAPGSAEHVTTDYFGNELVTDINGDGREDAVFLITQSGAGSGTFFYLVAALKTETGYEGSEAVYLGDRIAPQNTVRGAAAGTVVVNYADRAPGEPFSTPPSVGKSLVLKFNPETKQWGELVVNFEGESAAATSTPVPVVVTPSVPKTDPEPAPAPAPTLAGKTWQWVEASYNDGRTVRPNRSDAFTLTFNPDGSFGITTDCNGGGGTYAAKGSTLTMSELMSTMMYCEGSQESEFQRLLLDTAGYHITGDGKLILDLKFDSGSVIFK